VVTLQFDLIDFITGLQVELVLATVVHWPFVAMVPTAVTMDNIEIPESHFLAQCPSLIDLMLVVSKHNELPSGLAACLYIGLSVGHYSIEVTVLSVQVIGILESVHAEPKLHVWKLCKFAEEIHVPY
tara:strand:+ start:181 stop:561 length:381 start_codon:yes stop_codon:yes gene_type:complete